jgi:hypothetical protein
MVNAEDKTYNAGGIAELNIIFRQLAEVTETNHDNSLSR